MFVVCAFVLSVGMGGGLCRAQSNKGVKGVPNFGRVSDALFRGAQPSEAGFSSLKAMGVSVVVNFRDDGEAAAEKREVEALGMKYVAIPWSGHDDPSDAQVAQFLGLVSGNPNTKIFVHCRAGADRTGTMVAAYRIAMEHRSVAQAVEEMHAFHYHHLFLPQLKRYIESFPQTLLADAMFSAYAPRAAQAATAVAPMAAAAVAAPLVH